MDLSDLSIDQRRDRLPSFQLFNELPLEVILEIIDRMDYKTILKLCQVDKGFQKLCQTSLIRNIIIEKKFRPPEEFFWGVIDNIRRIKAESQSRNVDQRITTYLRTFSEEQIKMLVMRHLSWAEIIMSRLNSYCRNFPHDDDDGQYPYPDQYEDEDEDEIEYLKYPLTIGPNIILEGKEFVKRVLQHPEIVFTERCRLGEKWPKVKSLTEYLALLIPEIVERAVDLDEILAEVRNMGYHWNNLKRSYDTPFF